MKNPEKLLKDFARTDGLLKGTAIVSNLVTLASISLLPGFGNNGLFISSTIQMLTSGLLEIPSGIFADRFGWTRSVKLALGLKFLVTAAFLSAVISSKFNLSAFVWISFAAEAIVDSFASSFLSGAYQAAYLRWYHHTAVKEGIPTNTLPPLFLSSFKYANMIRFLLPILSIGLIVAFHHYFGGESNSSSYIVSLLAIGLILILRTLVYFKVSWQLDSISNSDPFAKSAKLNRVGFKQDFYSPWFVAYSSSVCVNMFALFYLVGTSFKLFKNTGMSQSLVWMSGVMFGLLVYILRTVFATLVFPRIAHFQPLNSIRNLNITLALVATAAGGLLAVATGPYYQLLILLILTISSIVFTECCQKYVESNLNEIIKTELKATWISTANALGYLCFGAMSLVILLMQLESIGTSIFCIGILFLAFTSIWCITYTKKKSRSVTFSKSVTQFYRKAIITIVAVLSFIDIGTFVITSYHLRSDSEESVYETVLGSVTEPLIQGSFIEASARLKRLQSKNSFMCAQILAWDYKLDTCTPNFKNNNIKINSIDHKIYIAENQAIGTLRVFFDRSSFINAILSRILFTMLTLSLGGVLLAVLFKKIASDLNMQLNSVLHLLNGETSAQDLEIEEFSSLGKKITEFLKERSENAKKMAVAEVASQVSHDIRSPLSALEMFMDSVQGITDEKKIIIRNAINRIRDIANTLLQKNDMQIVNINSTEPLSVTSVGEYSPTHLASLIESIITEKRVQYLNFNDVNIEFKVTSQNMALFSNISPTELKRLLSNLVNNSFEAMPSKIGRIEISAFSEDKNIRIAITDNGTGIPKDILANLGSRGGTYGKKGGSGLGLWHAKETCERFGGSLEINSEVNKGTAIYLRFPACPPPDWFLGHLDLSEKKLIVVYDDDESIHELWDDRLKKIKTFDRELIVMHAKTPGELRKIFGNIFDQMENVLFLLDYEISGVQNTGLDMIEELGIGTNSILITSRFEEESILSKCILLRTKLIPKSYSGMIPIGSVKDFV
jgi:signal transduction histidine kinase